MVKTCRVLLEPISTLIIVVVASLTIIFLNNRALLMVLFMFILLISVAISLRIFKAIFKVVMLMMLLYSALMVASQIIVLGFINIDLMFINILKFSSVAILSLSMINCINISKLIEVFRKLSPNLGISLALSIKMMKNLPKVWTIMSRLYEINMCCNNYIDRIALLILSIKAFLFLSTYSLMQSVEAFITRSKILRRK